MNQITKTMTIGEVVEQHPEVVETLQSFGVHCVGCGVSYWETLEEGLMGHGMTAEEIENVVVKLNEVKGEGGTPNVTIGPKKNQDSGASLTLTDKAAQKLKVLLSEQTGATGLRIQVVPGGCSGYQYAFDFEEKSTPEDHVIEQKGIHVFIDPESMSMLQGVTVDYLDGLHGSGFKISNPNASHSCGCGKSFG